MADAEKKKLEENLKFIQQKEKGILYYLTFLDLNERVAQFEQQKEKQSQLVKELKEKETQLMTVSNEVKSKMKLLNQLNAQLNTKEPRNTELDKLIKEKEARLRELENEMNKDRSGGPQVNSKEQLYLMSDNISRMEEKVKKMEEMESQLKQRDADVQTFKEKIVQLEFREAESQKQAQAFQERIAQLEKELKEALRSGEKKEAKEEGQQTEEDGSVTKEVYESLMADYKRAQVAVSEKDKMLDEVLKQQDSQKGSNDREKEEFLKQIQALQELLENNKQNKNTLEEELAQLKQSQDEAKEQQKEQDRLWRKQIQELEARSREQEVKIAQTEQKLNQSQIRSNEYKLQKEALEQKCDQQGQQLKDMKSEIRSLLEEKEELERSLQRKKQKCKQQAGQLRIMDEEVSRREIELENKSKLLTKYQNQIEDLKKENKTFQAKLRHIQNVTVKELQKQVRDKDNEIDVLKEMLRSAQLQIKSKDNENIRLMAKLKRMVKDGFVEKMKVNDFHKRNGSRVDIQDLDQKLSQLNREDDHHQHMTQEDEGEEEDEDFYPNDPSFLAKQQAREDIPKQQLVLPNIGGGMLHSQSQADLSKGGAKTMFSAGRNRQSQKDIHSNAIFNSELDSINMTSKERLQKRRQQDKHDGNRFFEDTYNKLVDQYQTAASHKDYKFASSGMNNVMYQSEALTPQKVKRNPYHNRGDNGNLQQSQESLQARQMDNQSVLSNSNPKKEKLINILEERSDYLVISPPKLK